MLAMNPHHPHHRKGKRRKRKRERETYKLSIKTALPITLIMLIILIRRQKMQNTQNRQLVSRDWVLGRWGPASSCRAGSGKPRTGLFSRQEPDSGMHRLQPGSEPQAGQRAGSSSEGGHE